MWEPGTPSRHEYDLGWKQSEKLPTYFARDFDPLLIGECELTGYRCDLFLLAWHGPNLLSGESTHSDDQSNPNNYEYFIIPVREFVGRDERPVKKLLVAQI